MERSDAVEDVTAEDVRGRAGVREWSALAVLVLAVLLIAIDGTVLSLAIPALSADLAPSATQLLWIGNAYSFALAGLLITMGTLGDRLGRKRLLMVGAAGFGAASVLAAFAPTPELLIAARALLGVAGATLMPSTLSLIRNLFADARQRTTAIAVWGAAAAGGAALGPLLGGLLLEHFWWGSVFILNVPVMVLLLVLGRRLLPESRDPHPGPFDPASALMSITGIVAVVYAVKELAGDGFSVGAGLAAAVGAAVLWAFARRQRRLRVPLLDLTLFRRPAFSGAVSANLLSALALSGLLFLLSQHFQLVQGHGPLQSGLRQLPLTLASLAVVAVVGMLLRRVGRGHLIGGALALAAGGIGLLAVAEGRAEYGWTALALTAAGLGVGLSLTLTTDAVVSAVPRQKAGAASAISETAYELGIALGIALIGSLHAALYRNGLELPAALSPPVADAARESLPSAVAAVGALPDAGRLLSAARDAFVEAMQVTSGAAAALLAVAAVLAWRVIPSSRPAPEGEVVPGSRH